MMGKSEGKGEPAVSLQRSAKDSGANRSSAKQLQDRVGRKKSQIDMSRVWTRGHRAGDLGRFGT